MIIRLECRGAIIQEILDADLKDELVIGRSQGCQWVIPKDDNVASSKHAALFRKGDKLWIRDLGSTNGIFFQGRNIPQKRLEVGDRISIGDCILAVDAQRDEDGGREPSRVQVLGGPQKGRTFELLPPRFTIGSDPAASLVLLDMLVSKQHAEITIKEDGSCWIRDAGSKNGSAVNGMPLRGDQERLLKDADKIAIAQFELLFFDGAVKHSHSQVWLRLGVVVATLAVVMGLYWGYQNLRPSAADLVRQARAEAAAGNFAAARASLAAAANARHAARNEIERGDLLRSLTIWETTIQTWDKARRALQAGNWIEASRELGMLQVGRLDVWTWSDQAAADQQASAMAKTMLEAMTRSAAALERENVPIDDLRKLATDLRQALQQVPEQPPAYLEPLLGALPEVDLRLHDLLAENDRLNTMLERLTGENPPFSEALAAIGEARRSPHGLLRRRADLLAAPVAELAGGFATLGQAVDAIRQLNFTAVNPASLKLPTPESCAVHPQLANLRQTIANTFANLQGTAAQVAFLHGELLQQVGRLDQMPAQLDYWRDPEIMAAVFACDTLERPLPKRSRNGPEGRYDEAVGTEDFYLFVSNLPELGDPGATQDTPFPPMLVQARLALRRLEAFDAFLSQPDLHWLRQDQLGQAGAQVKAMLARRDAIVDQLLEQAATDSGRQAIIAGGIALRLATPGTPLPVANAELREWLPGELRKLRLRLNELNTEYGRSSPQRQIDIRNDILRLGLPGDPIVRRLWAVRDAAAAH